MYEVIRQVYRALKPGRAFVMVLGDSAPYGVHIPTERYLGEIAKGMGFKSYETEELRQRGGKWAHNSQRQAGLADGQSGCRGCVEIKFFFQEGKRWHWTKREDRRL